MKNCINIAAAAMAAVLLTGCPSVSPEGAQMGVRVNDAMAPTARIMHDQVVIIDKVLQNQKNGKIAIESQGARRNATGTLNVIVQIRNRTDYPQVIEARTSFFDNGFAPIEKASGWTRVHLDGNGIGTYQESSLGAAQVAHYYVEVREAR
ncbi:hypothetical protein [Massilia sp. ST3]|uniref:hypothetical protein n=1 Tax=Massilia sp. ST3 TaxID=2824903 RepID=UPI001B82064B|nr:hypothetical protein [Massilia sp. ST3]MBQ5947453.1 hypothetical protein [Massilia sp. ST3]